MLGISTKKTSIIALILMLGACAPKNSNVNNRTRPPLAPSSTLALNTVGDAEETHLSLADSNPPPDSILVSPESYSSASSRGIQGVYSINADPSRLATNQSIIEGTDANDFSKSYLRWKACLSSDQQCLTANSGWQSEYSFSAEDVASLPVGDTTVIAQYCVEDLGFFSDVTGSNVPPNSCANSSYFCYCSSGRSVKLNTVKANVSNDFLQALSKKNQAKAQLWQRAREYRSTALKYINLCASNDQKRDAGSLLYATNLVNQSSAQLALAVDLYGADFASTVSQQIGVAASDTSGAKVQWNTSTEVSTDTQILNPVTTGVVTDTNRFVSSNDLLLSMLHGTFMGVGISSIVIGVALVSTYGASAISGKDLDIFNSKVQNRINPFSEANRVGRKYRALNKTFLDMDRALALNQADKFKAAQGKTKKILESLAAKKQGTAGLADASAQFREYQKLEVNGSQIRARQTATIGGNTIRTGEIIRDGIQVQHLSDPDRFKVTEEKFDKASTKKNILGVLLGSTIIGFGALSTAAGAGAFGLVDGNTTEPPLPNVSPLCGNFSAVMESYEAALLLKRTELRAAEDTFNNVIDSAIRSAQNSQSH